ncbi:UbiE/COQ5 methyltransferase [Nitrosococcus oceani ATCC 19707]|uniref:UbiE/COQ5 methyltransferase n=2 Tax=Nitrosococcus oceani TaxID=1229 RepID=Q3J725_NITOC|nr:class I SAM-dependent methyltransferase [Nitrosococcus oceani]ABA59371.1 UbiE/COQ5 methyltransferase [Nitrosococcus oceani ATCC 19707]KFI18107.1 SAM-dependent methlyltransferase [Nitrosococcus oceani C-27]GEM20058.1 SAM-dependent methyltransferase [Nitrosococcus oceani]
MENSSREVAPKTRGAVLKWQAPIYDLECALVGLRKKFRRETLRHAQLSPGEQILDVGCGTGVLTQLAAEKSGPSGKVVGVDPSLPMISLARKKAARAQSQAEFKLGVVERLPFGNETFDVVLSSLMLHHLPAELKRQGLEEIHRVLKPGGRLLAVDFDRPGHPLWWLGVWPQLFMPALVAHIRGEIPDYLAAAGFYEVQAVGRWFNLLTFWEAKK